MKNIMVFLMVFLSGFVGPVLAGIGLSQGISWLQMLGWFFIGMHSNAFAIVVSKNSPKSR